jgi:hypothetical protein
MQFAVSPKNRFAVEERIYFVNPKTRHTIGLFVTWREGMVMMSEPPDLSAYVPEDGIMMTNYDDEELGDDDGVMVDGAESEDEANRIVEAWSDSLEDGVSRLGWLFSDRELWFFGDLDVRPLTN